MKVKGICTRCGKITIFNDWMVECEGCCVALNSPKASDICKDCFYTMSEKEYSLCADCFDLEFLKPKEKPKEKPEEKPEEQKPSEPEGRLIDLEED